MVGLKKQAKFALLSEIMDQFSKTFMIEKTVSFLEGSFEIKKTS